MGEGMADTTWDTQDVLDGLIGNEGRGEARSLSEAAPQSPVQS